MSDETSPLTRRSDPGHSPSQPSTSDDASSLRAAALSTLKFKRKKHSSGQPPATGLPPRPPLVPASLVQLDYGNEDMAPLSPQLPPTRQLQPSAPVIEDGQAREEGEISDSEDVELASQAPSPRTSRAFSKSRTMPADVPQKLAISTSSAIKLESPTHSLLAPPFEQLPTGSAQRNGQRRSVSDPPQLVYLVDADHVRPGLQSTSTNNCKQGHPVD